MEQDAIVRCAIFDRVRLVRFGEGEGRGNGLSVCDQRSGTIVEHGRLQRRLRSVGCGTTPGLGETHVSCNLLSVQSLNARKVVHHAKSVGGAMILRISAPRSSMLNSRRSTCQLWMADSVLEGPTVSPKIFGMLDSVRNSSRTRNSVEQCCMLTDKLQRERCGSNLAIDCKVRGGVRECSSDMSWIQH